MTDKTLRDILMRAGLQSAFVWYLPDEIYEPATRNFVVENWIAWLDARPSELVANYDCGGGRMRRIPRWVKNAGDCDNLAIGTMAWADVGNALAAQKRGQERGGLAYGVLFYIAGPARLENYQVAGGHAINWFVDPSGAVHFFEPGMGEFVELNQEERNSIWFGLAA